MSELTQLQEEIHACLAQFQSLTIVNNHIKEINIKLNKSKQELSKLDKDVRKELKDVEKLEKAGIKSTFYNILGSKEEQLEKERQEYLEVCLQYNEHKKMIELMEYELDLLTSKTKDLSLVKKKLTQLKKERARQILNSKDIKLKNKFKALLKSIDDNRLFVKELEEAIQSGERSIKYMKQVRSFLNKAINWGQWDMMGKKGGISGHLKHNAIDQANKALRRAQHELNLFSRELEDINANKMVFHLNIDHFSRFTDYFFDNLITDWIIQQKIKNSKSSVESTMDSVSRIVQSLKHELDTAGIEFQKYNKEKDNFLTS